MKDSLSAEILNSLDELSPEQAWLFFQTHEKVIERLNEIGHSLDYTVGYAGREREWFGKMIVEKLDQQQGKPYADSDCPGWMVKG